MKHLSRSVVAIAIAASLAAPSCSKSNPAAPAGTAEIVVLGDSVAVSPRDDLAFPALLRNRLGAAWQLKNVSTNGATTGDGLARIDGALGDHPKILVIELGANDGLQGTAISTIRANLQKLIDRSKSAGARVLLCGMETTPLHGLTYFSEFRDVFPSVAHENAIPVTPFILGGVIGDPDLTTDLVHPNAAGAQRIADTIWPSLDNLVKQALAKPPGSG